MLDVEYTTKFKRDLKLARKRNKDLDVLRQIMKKIQHEEDLIPKLKDHNLLGNWNGHRELHIEPDWLLIYKIIQKENIVIFVRTGTPSDLFNN